jgi:hypothetical protein
VFGFSHVFSSLCGHSRFNFACVAHSFSPQSLAVKNNLRAAMKGATPTSKYGGYASCPLITGVDTTILAEFSAYTGQVNRIVLPPEYEGSSQHANAHPSRIVPHSSS